MKPLVVCYLIALAIVTTLALAPVSGWIFKNQLDLFVGSNVTGSGSYEGVFDVFMPAWLAKPTTYSGADPAEKLAHALFLTNPARNEALEQFAKEHPKDPVGMAVLVRTICTTPGLSPDAPRKESPAELEKRYATYRLGIWGCEEGEKLEPQNAYFPLMRAMFEMSLSRLTDMELALKDAAGKTDYDSHITDQGKALAKAVELAKGYRGEHVRTGVQASILLPEFASIKMLARYLNRAGSLSEKRDLIETTRLMALHDQTAIETLVAMSELRIVLRDPIPINASNQTKLSDGEWLSLASSFDSKLRAANLSLPNATALSTYQLLNRLVSAIKRYLDSLPQSYDPSYNDGINGYLAFFETAVPCGALAALVFSLPFAALALLFSQVQSDVFRKMAPHLVCLPVGLAVALMPTPAEELHVSTAALVLGAIQIIVAFLYLGAWQRATRSRIASITGVVVAFVSIGTLDGPAIAEGVAYLVFTGVFWMPKSARVSRALGWSSGVLFGLMIMVAGAAITWTTLTGRSGVGLVAAGLLGLAGGLLYTSKSVQSARIAACASVLILSAIYLAGVGIEVRANHSESLSKSGLLNEAKSIRKLAGIG